MAGLNDGAPAPSASAGWDSVLSDAIASTGIDPNTPLPADDAAPQAAPPESSMGASSLATPTAPSAASPEPAATGSPDPITPTTATPAAVDPDALPDATPFTYTVDGQPKTIDGVYVLPGEGLFVPEPKIQHFQQLATDADRLGRQNRELYDQAKKLESLTEWKQPGPNGTESVLRGAEGVAAQRAALGQLATEVREYRALLSNPANLAAFLTVDPTTNEIVFNEDKLENFGLRLSGAIRDAGDGARRHFQSIATAPVTGNAMTPDQIAAEAPATVKQVVALGKVSGLLPEDEAALARVLPRFVVTVTPQNQAQYPTARLGDTALDFQAFLPEVQHLAKLRQAATTAATTASATGKFNGGMEQGRKPAPKAPPSKSPTTPPAPPAKPGKAEAWDAVFKSAMAEITV